MYSVVVSFTWPMARLVSNSKCHKWISSFSIIVPTCYILFMNLIWDISSDHSKSCRKSLKWVRYVYNMRLLNHNINIRYMKSARHVPFKVSETMYCKQCLFVRQNGWIVPRSLGQAYDSVVFRHDISSMMGHVFLQCHDFHLSYNIKYLIQNSWYQMRLLHIKCLHLVLTNVYTLQGMIGWVWLYQGRF